MAIQTTTALTALKKSKFRSSFKLTDKDRQYIHSKGIDTIRSHAIDFITTRLAPVFPKLAVGVLLGIIRDTPMSFLNHVAFGIWRRLFNQQLEKAIEIRPRKRSKTMNFFS